MEGSNTMYDNEATSDREAIIIVGGTIAGLVLAMVLFAVGVRL